MSLLLLYLGTALSISFLCSLLESALLSSRSGFLADSAAAGSRGADLLLTLKRSRIDDAISAVLVLNTIANTAGATMAGAQAGRVFGSAWMGLFSAVLTLAILIVSEIIPKTLGAVHAHRLAPVVGWILTILVRVMTPVLKMTGAITRLITHGHSVGYSRSELAAVIRAATSDGAITPDESRALANLLRADEIRIGDVMTPRSVVFARPAAETVGHLLAESRGKGFSRVPLWEGDPDNIVGYLLLDDVLRHAADGGPRERSLGEFRREIFYIPELATVGSAMRQVLQHGEHIAMVTDEHGSVVGLVSLEDLTETLLGTEIVDESDSVADLRESAARLRDQRLERLRHRRQLMLDAVDGQAR